MLTIDTSGCDMRDSGGEGESKSNKEEAALAAAYVRVLLKAGLRGGQIAVISPYNAQVALLRDLLAPHPEAAGIEVRSVDGFQGQEKEAVVLSLVRSNEEGGVGFLSDDRRINVAVTRARRHVAVLCDSETVGMHGFLRRLLDHVEARGQVRSAAEFTDNGTAPPFEAWLDLERAAARQHALSVEVAASAAADGSDAEGAYVSNAGHGSKPADGAQGNGEGPEEPKLGPKQRPMRLVVGLDGVVQLGQAVAEAVIAAVLYVLR